MTASGTASKIVAHSPRSRLSRFELLDPLRGCAALWVLLFHCVSDQSPLRHWKIVDEFITAGYLGVPMFFVISGYCITAAGEKTLDRRGSVGDFIYRRCLRIYPTFWLSILLVIGLAVVPAVFHWVQTGSIFYHPKAWMEFSLLHWLSILSLAEVFHTGEFPMRDYAQLNGVYWTLSIEIQFYLVVALAVRTRRFFWPTLWAISVTSVAVGFYPAFAFTGIFCPFWLMFAGGSYLYYLRTRGIVASKIRPAKRFAILGVFLVSCVIAVYQCQESRPTIWEPIAAAVMCAVLWWLCPLANVQTHSTGDLQTDTTLLSRIGRRILGLLSIAGAMSYSIYLAHIPAFRFFKETIDKQLLPVLGIALSEGILIFLTLAVCVAFYWGCERPFVRMLQRR